MRALVFACFFLSGASGLIFEMVWTRELTLVFGSTTLAISTVLTAFMGGLGLGSFAASRFADRLRDPVRAYAIAELAIGLYALSVPLILGHYGGLNRWLWDTLGDNYPVLSVVRFAASAVVLLLPTTLMGATLPILARAVVSRPFEIGGVGLRLGRLYGANLFGAVTGSFLAGFVFLPTVGVRLTNAVAACFNIGLAAAIFGLRPLLSRRQRPPTLEEMAAEVLGKQAVQQPPFPPLPLATRRVVLAGFLLAGLSAMTLQVLWTRSLAVVIGSSAFSFTLILLGFLIGLGSGSSYFGRLADRDQRPVASLALLQLCIVAAVGLSYVITDELPFFFAWLLSSTRAGVDTIQICQFVAICASVLPATFLMGGVFPFTVRIVAGRFEHLARDLGNAYALNTVGAIVGSFASGFVVLPVLGLQRGIYAAVLVALTVAARLFLVAPDLPRSRRILGVGAAIACALAGPLLPRWNLVNLSVGFFRVSIAKDYIERRKEKKTWEKPKLVFYEDGISTTVSVDQWGKTFSMKNNGKVDASSDADMPTQISVGLLPLLLYPHDVDKRPPRAALIGYGSGVTAGAMTQFPIASLEVVELEPAVYRAAQFFDHINHQPTRDPRVTARIGDGRNFLTQRRDRFDVIVSQPSNPWITGVSNLFTREYFRDIRGRLAEDGIFCQWAQLYEMAPWNVKTIYRTLREEFRHVLVFAAEDLSSDTILIASQSPISIDIDRIARLLERPIVRREAERAGFKTVHDIPATLLLAPDEVDAFTAGAALNTDDNARIEFAAPRDLLGYARYDSYLARVYGPLWPYGRLTPFVRGYDGADAAHKRGQLSRSLLLHGKTREAGLWAARAAAAGADPAVDHARALLDLIATREDRDPELPLTPEGDLNPPILPRDVSPEVGERIAREYTEIEALMTGRKFASAYKVLAAWPERLWGRLGQDFSLVSGFLHYKAEFYGDAIDDLRPLADDAGYASRRPAVLYYLGRAYFANANYGKAGAALEKYLALVPPAKPAPRPTPSVRPQQGDTMVTDGRASIVPVRSPSVATRANPARGGQKQSQSPSGRQSGINQGAKQKAARP
ncbi:MAG TPA: fused MFS/spermidine synthase [Polyangia bacterium]